MTGPAVQSPASLCGRQRPFTRWAVHCRSFSLLVGIETSGVQYLLPKHGYSGIKECLPI